MRLSSKSESYAFYIGDFKYEIPEPITIIPYTYDGESSQNQLDNTDLFSKGYMSVIISEESANLFKKNMFVVFSENELKKHSIYDSPALGSLDVSKNIKVSDIFQVINNNKIRVNLQNAPSTTKSVQYWYYESKYYYYNLVFGVNITPADIDRGYLNIYVSSISKRDTRVYDYNHNVIGHIKNYANNEEKFGAGNFYEEID